MRFVVIAHRNQDADPSEFKPELMEAEAKMVLGMVVEDFVREIYSRTDGNGAVIIVEAQSDEEVKKRLAELPLAKAGLLTAEVYGIKVYRAIEAMAKS